MRRNEARATLSVTGWSSCRVVDGECAGGEPAGGALGINATVERERVLFRVPWLVAHGQPMADDSSQHPVIRRGSCRMRDVHETPSPTDLSSLADKYSVSSSVVEDLYAGRRAGARDAELINLLQQKDRGGLDPERARALAAELPQR